MWLDLILVTGVVAAAVAWAALSVHVLVVQRRSSRAVSVSKT
jgi:hypothetical protein